MKVVELIVEREKSETDWTLSQFYIAPNGLKPTLPSGFGVEDEDRPLDKKVHGETRIPNGIYEIDLVQSPRFSNSFYVDTNGCISENKSERFTQPHLLIHVKGVPGFSHILWHWGNTDLDTDGCYLVGAGFIELTKGGKKRKGVGASKAKYAQVYPLIFKIISDNKKAGKKTYVEYRDK